VSEQILTGTAAQLGYTVPFIQCSCSKIQDRRQIKTQTIYTN